MRILRVGGVQYGSAEWQACHVAQATPGCRQCHACHWVRRRQRSVATATQCNGAAQRQEPKACHPFRQKNNQGNATHMQTYSYQLRFQTPEFLGNAISVAEFLGREVRSSAADAP